MAYCRSCGIGAVCKYPAPDQKGCERPVDRYGNHLRAGTRYSQLFGRPIAKKNKYTPRIRGKGRRIT